MVQAYNCIAHIEVGYQPRAFDCEHPYFNVPNRKDCYQQPGPSVKQWYGNT